MKRPLVLIGIILIVVNENVAASDHRPVYMEFTLK